MSSTVQKTGIYLFGMGLPHCYWWWHISGRLHTQLDTTALQWHTLRQNIPKYQLSELEGFDLGSEVAPSSPNFWRSVNHVIHTRVWMNKARKWRWRKFWLGSVSLHLSSLLRVLKAAASRTGWSVWVSATRWATRAMKCLWISVHAPAHVYDALCAPLHPDLWCRELKTFMFSLSSLPLSLFVQHGLITQVFSPSQRKCLSVMTVCYQTLPEGKKT